MKDRILRDGAARLLRMRAAPLINLILRSGPKGRVSRDGWNK